MTLVSCRDNIGVGPVQRGSRSPQMVFCRKKMKYKEWLKQAEPDNEYLPVPSPLSSLMRYLIELEHDFSRSHILTHGDAQFTWAGPGICLGSS